MITYLIGQPGSGKTTLMAALTENTFSSVIRKPFAHVEYLNGVYGLGEPRSNGFGGTDALGMSVQPKVLEWLQGFGPSLVIGEGDRLANEKFFHAVQQLGLALFVVLLDVPDDVASARCAERGSTQNLTWLAGRRTKIRNLTPWASYRLDGTKPVEVLREELREIPVFSEFA